MALFQDTMDNERVVKPLKTEGKRTICAVYLKNSGRLNFVGNAPIPTVLLADAKENPINHRIGFVPFSQ